MKKIVILIVTISVFLSANVSNKEIANMFILGFYGTSSNAKTQICKDLQKGLGGVILFQKLGKNIKNFSNATELKTLTANLKACGTKPLIAIDQEGGLVQRLKLSKKYPKAKDIAKNGAIYAKQTYNQMAQELNSVGINLNFAPVVDIALNPKNRVIVGFGRSYGKDANSVIKYSKIFIDAMHNYNIATSIKHFPGHGSSLGDTHKGFVDVTNLWKNEELKPYIALKNYTDTVMVAHIFNSKIDSKYPASLSRKTIQNLLRDKIGFRGVVVSDDLQMGAIAKHYSLRDRVKLSINSGVDIMLFANQLSSKNRLTINRLIFIVRDLLKNGEINEQSIKNSNIRINNLKNRLYK